jgi:hypothetical protein
MEQQTMPLDLTPYVHTVLRDALGPFLLGGSAIFLPIPPSVRYLDWIIGTAIGFGLGDILITKAIKKRSARGALYGLACTGLGAVGGFLMAAPAALYFVLKIRSHR